MGTSRHLRNLETFTFTINSKHEVNCSNRSTITSNSNVYDIYLDGIIYNVDKKQLSDGFASNGIDYVKQLEGSFVLFILHQDAFYLVTDKLNSRKAYYAFIEDTWHISNDIDNLPKNRCKVSIDGIANYLANGVMLNGLTLFDEIKCSDRASIHHIERGEIAIKRYWDLVFTYSSDRINESDSQQRFDKLLISSIKRRYDSDTETSISLSAGYDARGILGIMSNKIDARKINCFSYALKKDPAQHSDAFYAKQLAEQCQYNHEVFVSYKGDFINILTQNASEGKCLTNFSDELDAWHELRDRSGFPDIFVGDMNFGISLPFKTLENILERARIVESEGLKWMKRYIPKKVYQDICSSLDTLVNDILQKVNKFSDPQDKLDYLYLDQRINHGLLTWRENICTQAGFVHLPYLDGQVMDFVATLPPQLRTNKLLYRKTISDMLPDFFSIPFASSAGYKVDWTREIINNKKALTELVQGSSSRLDEFIDGRDIIGMIRKQNITRAHLKVFIYKVMRYIRRRIKLADVILGKIFGPMHRYVSSDILIIRLLLLRIYLSNSTSENP